MRLARIMAAVVSAGSLGLGVAATVAPASAASRAATAITACAPDSGDYSFVSPGTTLFYLGAPNAIVKNSAAELKPAMNSTTLFVHCNGAEADSTPSFSFLMVQGGVTYALTTRASAPGANVTLEPVGNGSNGYLSQRWTYSGSGPYQFKNVKTGMYLRVRNSGPMMYQTVTTGNTPTSWNQSS